MEEPSERAGPAGPAGPERGFTLDGEAFAALFPFHIVLDRRMRVVQARPRLGTAPLFLLSLSLPPSLSRPGTAPFVSLPPPTPPTLSA